MSLKGESHILEDYLLKKKELEKHPWCAIARTQHLSEDKTSELLKKIKSQEILDFCISEKPFCGHSLFVKTKLNKWHTVSWDIDDGGSHGDSSSATLVIKKSVNDLQQELKNELSILGEDSE